MNFKGFSKLQGRCLQLFIAEGKYDVLIESGLKIVDILPIILIVKTQEQ